MTRLNLDLERFYIDGRIDQLAILANEHRLMAEARIIRVWAHCYAQRREFLDASEIDDAAQWFDTRRFVDLMIRSRLAEPDPDGGDRWRIKGVKKRIGYLLAAREAGLKSARERRERFGTAQPKRTKRSKARSGETEGTFGDLREPSAPLEGTFGDLRAPSGGAEGTFGEHREHAIVDKSLDLSKVPSTYPQATFESSRTSIIYPQKAEINNTTSPLYPSRRIERSEADNAAAEIAALIRTRDPCRRYDLAAGLSALAKQAMRWRLGGDGTSRLLTAITETAPGELLALERDVRTSCRSFARATNTELKALRARTEGKQGIVAQRSLSIVQNRP